MKMKIPKINSLHFGSKWLLISIGIATVPTLVLYLILGRIVWLLVIIGGAVLLAFAVVFAVEMRQDFGRVPYEQKHLRDEFAFDPAAQYAVIRSSICTGEKVAGFRDRQTGHFTEVLLIRSPEDERRFREAFGVDDIKTEY